MHDNDPSPGPVGPDPRRRATTERAVIYRADTWHVSDGTASHGSGRPPAKNPVRRVFSAEYKLAILAEYDACSESGEKGAILRREGLYTSLITDWRRARLLSVLAAARHPYSAQGSFRWPLTPRFVGRAGRRDSRAVFSKRRRRPVVSGRALSDSLARAPAPLSPPRAATTRNR